MPTWWHEWKGCVFVVTGVVGVFALIVVMGVLHLHGESEEAEEAARVAKKMEKRLNEVGTPALARTSGGHFYVILRKGSGGLAIQWVSGSRRAQHLDPSVAVKTVVEVAAWDEEERLDRLLRKLFEAETRGASTKVPTVKPLTAPAL